MDRRVLGLGVGALLLMGTVTACSDSGGDTLDRDEFIGQMTSGDDAIPDEIAICIADRFEEAGIEVGKSGKPSDDDREKAEEIAMACVVDAVNVNPADIEGLTPSTDGS